MGRTAVDTVSLGRLIQREVERFEARTPSCHQMLQRARRWLPLGVASSFQDYPPYPLFIRRGQGSRIWDVDGNKYRDFHLGFGALAVGHAHPRLIEALRGRL